jgi:hypothetical protein
MAKKTVSSNTPAVPAQRAVKPTGKKTTGKKKTVTERKVAKPVAAKTRRATTAKAPVITSDDIALRAYFISEKRRTASLPGDEHHDWLEAERQLVAESKRRKKTKTA